MGSLLEFLNRAKETNETITGLAEYVYLASALRGKPAAASEADSGDTAAAMKKIHAEFKARADQVKERLSEMKDEAKVHLAQHGHDRSFAARSNHLQSLGRRLGLVVEDFRRVQSGFAQHEQERLKAQYLIAKPNATQEELASLEEQGKAKPMLQSIFTIGNKSAKDVIMKAERRRSSIEEILKGMTDLKELSDDFVGYISTNGAEVDRIHIDVRNSLSQSKLAGGTLEQVAKRKIRRQQAKKITTIACGVFLGLGILYVLAKVKSSL